MNKNISDKDKKDWENFLSKKEKISDKDSNFIKKNINKSISFDLHGYSLDEANKKIKDLILNCYNKDINKLIVVTGKGLHSKNEKDPYVSKDFGILRYSVPDYVINNRDLMNKINKIEEAKIEDGGSGAFYIYFKKRFIK